VIVLAYYLQQTVTFSPDVSYLIHASHQLWRGEHYGVEIFETNPPMILYLYLPVVFIKNVFLTSVQFALRSYVILLATLSITTSFILLKKLVPRDLFYQNCMIITGLFVLLLLPVHAFGQREHIFLIFIFPYLFSVALYLEKKSLHPALQLLISVMAALGFAIKPFFLIPLFFIECYVIFYKKDLWALFRLSNMVIACVFVLYFISIVVWQKGYFDIILPMVMKYYFPFFSRSWIETFSEENVLFCLAMIVVFFMFYRLDQYKILGMIFCLATAGMVIGYIIPKQSWYYHLYPALGMAFILMLHFLKQLTTQTKILSHTVRLKNILVFIVLLQIVGFLPLNNYLMLIFMTQKHHATFSRQLAEYVASTQGERSIFCFNIYASDCFPLVYDENVRYAERFPSFWWYNGLRKVEKINPHNPQLLQDKKFLLDAVSDDLNHYQARWIVIDDRIYKHYEGDDFNLIYYLSQNENFKEAIKNYRYIKKIDNFSIYERKEVS
jgi:hypothetical protein